MDTTLLQQLNQVRYRELSDLIGRTVTISSLHRIGADLLLAVNSSVPPVSTVKPDFDQRAILGKYKMLDVAFPLQEPELSPSDTVGRQGLVELGYMEEHEAATNEKTEKDDDYFLRDLIQQTQQGKEWLKFVLDVWPLRDACREYMNAIRPNGQNADSDEAWGKLMIQVDQLFPGQFRIRDACITNARYIWFHKHFYM